MVSSFPCFISLYFLSSLILISPDSDFDLTNYLNSVHFSFMGFEMKPEKDLVLSKNQCKSKNNNNPNPNSVNSSRMKKNRIKNKKKTVMTWRQRVSDSPAEDEIPAVRRLFNTCKDVFSGGAPGVVPEEGKIQKLREILDAIKPEDVGLSPTMPYFRQNTGRGGQTSPTITYLHLHQCEQFSIGIFCLPPSAVIPLHNHPGMTVFSKLLFGTMHIKSYDWVADAPMKDPKTRLAELKVNATFTAPCNASILYPEAGGNMHRFTAKTACAVLDVLGPPYCNPEGRHCTYFLEFPLDKFPSDDEDVLRGEEKKGDVLRGEEKKKGYAWLEERDDNPEDLNVVGALYRGPRVED